MRKVNGRRIMQPEGCRVGQSSFVQKPSRAFLVFNESVIIMRALQLKELSVNKAMQSMWILLIQLTVGWNNLLVFKEIVVLLLALARAL